MFRSTVFDAGAAARGLQFLPDGYDPSYDMASREARAFKTWVAAHLPPHCHLGLSIQGACSIKGACSFRVLYILSNML